MFQPHFEVLPAAQKELWPELAQLPRHFVLYGGTALALRLGHRESLDFDFFSHERFEPADLLAQLSFLQEAKVLQNTAPTLTVVIERGGQVKVSFFGGLTFGRVGEPDETPDGVLSVASLLDIAGIKAAVVTQRAESKDYFDLLTITQNGISLELAIAAARTLYGERYNPLLTLKALTYFGDGDLHRLDPQQRAELLRLVADCPTELPLVPRVSSKFC
jgi:hypothetical protein